jgi:hypothetical protein
MTKRAAPLSAMTVPRRRFLGAAAIAAGATAALAMARIAAPPVSGVPPATKAGPAGYRVSDHILKYYASANL